MCAQGVSALIATPHIQASVIGLDSGQSFLATVERAWEAFQRMVATEHPQLVVAKGCEILLDSPNTDFTDERIRLAGTKFLLVEFPWGGAPNYATRALFDIRTRGYVPIVAHPERYAYMDARLTLAQAWIDAGAFLQINAGSFAG